MVTFSSTMRQEPLSRTSTSCFLSALTPNFCVNDTMRRSAPSGSTFKPDTIESGTGPVATCSRRCSSHALAPAVSVGATNCVEYSAITASASRFAQACAQLATTSSGERATVPVERKYEGGASRQAVRPAALAGFASGIASASERFGCVMPSGTCSGGLVRAPRYGSSGSMQSGAEPPHAASNGRDKARSQLNLRSEEHTSELQSLAYLVCRLLLEKKKKKIKHVQF